MGERPSNVLSPETSFSSLKIPKTIPSRLVREGKVPRQHNERSTAIPLRDFYLTIALIDGERLAELMLEHNVGLSTVATYWVKKVDSDFFLEE